MSPALHGWNLNQNIRDALGGHTRNSRSTKMFNSLNPFQRQAAHQMPTLLFEDLRPSRIVGDDRAFLFHNAGNHSLKRFLKRLHVAMYLQQRHQKAGGLYVSLCAQWKGVRLCTINNFDYPSARKRKFRCSLKFNNASRTRTIGHVGS